MLGCVKLGFALLSCDAPVTGCYATRDAVIGLRLLRTCFATPREKYCIHRPLGTSKIEGKLCVATFKNIYIRRCRGLSNACTNSFVDGIGTCTMHLMQYAVFEPLAMRNEV